MSSCLILQDNKNFYIGADTACSVKIGDNYYRYNDDTQKIFICGEDIYFCAGNMNTVEDVVSWINKKYSHNKHININRLSNYLKEKYKVNNNKLFDIEIVLCRKDPHPTIYQISQYNNFECVTHQPKNNGINIVCSGYQTKKLYELSRQLLLMGATNIPLLYKSIFNVICDNKTGGNLILYRNTDMICKEHLVDKNVEYVSDYNDLHLLLADACIAGYIEGSSLVGGKIGIGERDDGSYNFSVNYEGHMIAQSADVVGKITADSGAIRGDLEISGALKHTNGDYTVQLRGVQEDPTDSVFHIAEKSGSTTKYPFQINGDGSFIATKATITGKITTDDITATGGKIGGFDITSSYISKTKKTYNDTYSGVYLGTDGIGLGASKFYVTSAGKLTATDATITGKITTTDITATGGTIGGFTITSSYLAKDKKSYSDSNAGVYVGTTGIGLGAGKFYVTSAGKLTATDATITGKITSTEGTIGGWTIGQNMISGKSGSYEARMSKAAIGSSGSVVFGVYNGSKWVSYIDGVGNLYTNNATVTGTLQTGVGDAVIQGKIVATSGEIGGCKITNNTLTVKNANIESINGKKIETGTVSGNRLESNTVTTAYTSGGINTSLGYANFSNDVFNKIDKANFILVGTVDADTTFTDTLNVNYLNVSTISYGGMSLARKSANVMLADGSTKTIYYVEW